MTGEGSRTDASGMQWTQVPEARRAQPGSAQAGSTPHLPAGGPGETRVQAIASAPCLQIYLRLELSDERLIVEKEATSVRNHIVYTPISNLNFLLAGIGETRGDAERRAELVSGETV